MSDEYLILWVNSGDDCGLIEQIQEMQGVVPDYIIREVESLKGRPARGRLWVSKDIPVDRVSASGFLFENQYFDHRGGIVFHAKDLSYVRILPGFITTLSINPLPVEVA